ncbi:MAG: MFS transporter [Lacisediminihabitans sp.]
MGASETRPGVAPGFPWLALVILAGAIFVSVTSEFLPTGLLPQMADGLRVSESRIGLLVTVFATTVVLTAAPLTALTRRFGRKNLVVAVLVGFAVTNFLGAMAPNYEVMLLSRVLGGLAHGLFWAVVGAYAGHLVPKHQVARAVAVTGAGATLAFILGVPVGTALGHALGWRLAFTAVGATILLLMLLVLRFLPQVNHLEELATGEIPLPLRRDPTIFGVVVICVITTVLMIGQNLFYTYIVPYFIGAAGFAQGAVSLLLLAYGVAGAVGLLLFGFVGARFPRLSLVGGFVLVVFAVLLIGGFPRVSWLVVAALLLWGAAFGGTPALLQTRMLHTASARLRDVSAAYFTTAFNIGIGGGALVGGFLLDGYGLGTLPFVDVAVTVVGILLILLSDRILRQRATRSGPAS